jgi:hypothetical protein
LGTLIASKKLESDSTIGHAVAAVRQKFERRREIVRAAMMFSQAKAEGVLAVDLDCTLCATLLFGAIEMELTSFVLGLIVRCNESLLTQAEEQVPHLYLFGLKGRR